MRDRALVGFWVSVAVGIAAGVCWSTAWWLTLVLALIAVVIFWVSLGMFARASVEATRRVIAGTADETDHEAYGDLGPVARREAIRQATLGRPADGNEDGEDPRVGGR